MHILELIQLQQYCNETEIAMILRSNKKFVVLVNYGYPKKSYV